MKNPTIREACNIITKKLEIAKSDAPRLCAQVLIRQVLEVDAIYLSTHATNTLTSSQWQAVQILSKRHEMGEPLAYIVGYKEFFGRNFKVNKHTLIPRPESEDVLEAALKSLHTKSPRFLDIGTGSGCLGLSLALECQNSFGLLLDISFDALKVAEKNLINLNAGNNVQLIHGDLYNLPVGKNCIDLIISNPPYVSMLEYEGLMANVREFEPFHALVPKDLTSKVNKDRRADELDQIEKFGLLHIQSIAMQVFEILKPNGVCIVEHGYTQGALVRELFAKYAKWSSIETGKDLSGCERFCLCKR